MQIPGYYSRGFLLSFIELTISKLKRKYGGSVEAVLDYYNKASEKLDNIEKFENRTLY